MAQDLRNPRIIHDYLIYLYIYIYYDMFVQRSLLN